MENVASALVLQPTRPGYDGRAARRLVVKTLERIPEHILKLVFDAGGRVKPLSPGQKYNDASATLLKLGVDVDSWTHAPAGLFIVEEKTCYIRAANSQMTVAHEFGHAVDCALGGGGYMSGFNRRIRKAFANTRDYVTPYAATGLDEYFAECFRAYAEINDENAAWPDVTRARLRAFDEPMHDYMKELWNGSK